MYDTIHFFLKSEDIEGGFPEDVVEKVCAVLSRANLRYRRHSNTPFYQGNLENLTVQISDDLLIVMGSMHQYTMGSQLIPMPLADFALGLHRISQALGLPMEKATVIRLDVAFNIETDYKPEAYYSHFGISKGYRRDTTGSTLYYKQSIKNGIKQIAIYDKLKQTKNKKDIPAALLNKNLIRIEFKMLKKVANQLNLASVTGAILAEPSFYREMVQQWEAQYHAIQKERVLALGSVQNAKDLERYYQIKGIHASGGVHQAISHIKRLLLQGQITHQQAATLKRKTKQLAESPSLTTNSPLIDELNQKVEQIVQDICIKYPKNILVTL